MRSEFLPFGLHPAKVEIPEIGRDYLFQHYLALAKVIRFSELDNYFWENDQQHIDRLRQRAVGIEGIGQLNRDILLRIIEVHDLGETGQTTDASAVKKELDDNLVRVTNENEAEVAKKLLNQKDWGLYQEYEKASNFWKGKKNEEGILPEALVAYLLDKVDGNLAFHYRYREAKKNGTTIQEPHEDVLKHLFIQTNKFYQYLPGIADQQILKICQSILDDQLGYLRYLWLGVPTGEIPVHISKGLGL